jgi:flagellar biosynthetic protein FlhB
MNMHQIRVDGPGLLSLLSQIELMLIGVLGVPLLLLLIAGVGSNLIQHRLVFSTDPLTPKFSKISPAAGFARLFGKQAGANFLKGIFKVLLVGVVMCLVLWPERHRLDAMIRFDPMSLLNVTKTIAIQLMGTVVAALALVARSIICSSTGSGSSGRRCRWKRSRKNTSNPKATRTSRDGSGSFDMPA